MHQDKETTQLSCIGMKCPRPIIEIAKAARKSPSGSLLRVQADDLAFGSDVQAWCETRNAALLSLEQEDNIYTALIQLA